MKGIIVKASPCCGDTSFMGVVSDFQPINFSGFGTCVFCKKAEHCTPENTYGFYRNGEFLGVRKNRVIPLPDLKEEIETHEKEKEEV